ncbi:MAG: FAD-dependent oxidoreductase [Dehalococcoidia bacterium]|nr:FAD-dependent oxidoreductase [Dehalococcoidia bacterium]MQF92322.1 FAD-dependent oxidoreductase [SAR202 cluster bacterium]
MLAHRRTYGTPKITVYGAPRCSDYRQSKQFLGEQPVRHNWVDIGEDEEGRKRVQDLNDGKQIIPTIIFEDSSILVEPSSPELVAKWGISPKSKREYYDLVIVGSGFAGLTTALYAARQRIETLVIEKGRIQARPAPLSASTTTPDSLKESAATN